MRAKKPAAKGCVAVGPHGVGVKWGQIPVVGEGCLLLRAPTMGGPILLPLADLFTPAARSGVTALQKAPGGFAGGECRWVCTQLPRHIAERGRVVSPRSPRPNPSHGTGRMRPFAQPPVALRISSTSTNPAWAPGGSCPARAALCSRVFGCFFSISSPSRGLNSSPRCAGECKARCPRPDPAQLTNPGARGQHCGCKVPDQRGVPISNYARG